MHYIKYNLYIIKSDLILQNDHIIIIIALVHIKQVQIISIQNIK